MIEILLVDDQPMFREGLRRVIEDWDDFKVVGEASNGKEALEASRALLPDIILMDVNMPVMDGIEAAKLIHDELPSLRVVMLTVSDEEVGLFEAIKNGAQGYLLKDTPIRRLYSELRGVMVGETPLSGTIAAKMLAEFRQTSDFGQKTGKDVSYAFDTLTKREKEILSLLTEGFSNHQIADCLFVSEKTVKKHLSNIFAKLQLNNRSQLAIYALRAGLGADGGIA
jgi:DNA-binding NarL/FixJ family response regulator